MSDETYLAVFLGSKNSAKRKAWDALSEGDRSARQAEGMAAWHSWVDKHQSSIVQNGGPLGKTKKVSAGGISDVSNELAVFMLVRAPSHEQAAALFENHPHFTIFPGEAVEVMPVLPIPST